MTAKWKRCGAGREMLIDGHGSDLRLFESQIGPSFLVFVSRINARGSKEIAVAQSKKRATAHAMAFAAVDQILKP